LFFQFHQFKYVISIKKVQLKSNCLHLPILDVTEPFQMLTVLRFIFGKIDYFRTILLKNSALRPRYLTKIDKASRQNLIFPELFFPLKLTDKVELF